MLALRARSATPGDYELYTRAFVELSVPDPPQRRERWIRDNLPTTLFFEEHGKFVAYAFFQVLEETGYVRNMVVEPSARGRGIGHAVMRELCARFIAAGCVEWCLNVRPDNVAAIRVYEDSGLPALYRSRRWRVGPDAVAALPPPSPEWRVDVMLEDEDPSVEAAFGIQRGLIALRRKVPEVHVLVMRGSAQILGVACYDVERSTVPFAAQSPAAARALLEALLPLAAGGPITLVQNAQPELDRTLAEAKAQILLDVVHYRGSLLVSP